MVIQLPTEKGMKELHVPWKEVNWKPTMARDFRFLFQSGYHPLYDRGGRRLTQQEVDQANERRKNVAMEYHTLEPISVRHAHMMAIPEDKRPDTAGLELIIRALASWWRATDLGITPYIDPRTHGPDGEPY